MNSTDPRYPTPRTADDIFELFRGAIHSGQLGDGERLPTVRQTARDFGVAQATAAKAYKQLEQEGLVVSRTAAGTRVAPGASRAAGHVVAQARALAEAAQQEQTSFENAVAVLRAVWSLQPGEPRGDIANGNTAEAAAAPPPAPAHTPAHTPTRFHRD